MAITATNLSFGFSSDSIVFRDVHFSISAGSVVGLVGASGAGKSTLLRVIAGLLPNDTSAGLSGGINVFGQTPREYRRQAKLACVFQHLGLLPFLSAADNVKWPLRHSPLLRTTERESSERVAHILSLVGLTEDANTWPHQLSGGMQARVAIARALVSRPVVLLVDEAFSSLDIGWRTSLYRRIVDYHNETGLTVLFVSHDVDDVIAFADKCFILGAEGRGLEQQDIRGKAADTVIGEIRRSILRGHRALNVVHD